VDKKNVAASLGVNMLSGGLAGTGSLCIVYPLGTFLSLSLFLTLSLFLARS